MSRQGIDAEPSGGSQRAKAIVALTVPEGKRLIAEAVVRMPEVVQAREHGKIFLKGGTTVSAVAEELAGVPLRISGRISPRGLKMSRVDPDVPHCALIQGGQVSGVGDDMPEVVAGLGEGDAFIVGANIIDAYGGAAMMAGGPMGNRPGRIMTGAMVEGVPIIVVAGMEKLVPGRVEDAVRAAGRKGVSLSMGMAVGLMPVFGRVITEVEAVRLLAPVDCQVIGRGGIDGAEGGIALLVSGTAPDVKHIFRLVQRLKGAATSGHPESLPECEQASVGCQGHLACVYHAPGLIDRDEYGSPAFTSIG